MPVRLIAPSALQESLRSNVGSLVIDARRRGEYLDGHIPGAIWMGWEHWCEPPPPRAPEALKAPGYWGKLATQNAMWYAERLQSTGVDRSRTIVVYANGPASRGREARIAWMLLYLGAEDVRLVDGGWPAWVEVGGEAEMAEAERAHSRFEVTFREQRRALISEVAEPGESRCLVDTRSGREFLGLDYDYMPRRGRIPGAIHVPFTDLFEAGGRYLGAERYNDLVRPRLARDAHPVAYCEVGVRACTFALLHEMYTGETAAVCDGSFMEWALDENMPVEVGET